MLAIISFTAPRTIPLRPGIMEQRLAEIHRLIESDMWRQRRHFRVGHRFDDHRPLGCKGLVPRRVPISSG